MTREVRFQSIQQRSLLKRVGSLGSDELGFIAVERSTEEFDFQTAVLDLTGPSHEQRDYRSQGRDYCRTDVSGSAIDKLMISPESHVGVQV